jgi:hypothetical protein
VAAGIARVASGQKTEEGRVVVSVTAANSDESPLRIVGFRMPEKVGDPPRVVLQNVSSKDIREFSFQAVIGRPDGTGRILNGVDAGPTKMEDLRDVIPPHGSRETPENVLIAGSLAFSASVVLSNCLHVTAMIVAIDFADGTHWYLSGPKEMERLWKDSLPIGGTKSCGTGSVTQETLRRLEGWRHKENGSPTRADSSVKQSYSFSCSLGKTRGKLMALCPM